MNHEKEFGPIRKLIWPIYNYELKKFLPLAFIMFCLIFNYTLLHDTKDAIVVNAAGAGIIPFLKFYGVMPTAILFVLAYIKLANLLKQEYVFYVITTAFLLFFAAFAFLIYPNIDVLHPSSHWVNEAHKNFPALSGFINLFGYWTYSIFYILAEIWGSVMITLMFWQFANEIVKMKESKRFYGLLVVISNIALIFSGKCMKFCSQGIKQYFPNEDDVWQISLYLMMGIIIIMGILAMLIYRWMHTNVLTNPFYYENAKRNNKSEEHLTIKDSIKIITHSPELGLIAILLIAYGVTINLIEVQWKEQVRLCFAGNMGSFGGFMGDYSFWSGIFTVVFGLFISSNVLRICSWFKAAVIPPLFMLTGGGLFFIFVLSIKSQTIKDLIDATFTSIQGEKAVIIATFLGVIVVSLSKALKYTLFDPTKEMAYIPLSEQVKTTGKAAVDVIGGRAGQSGGAFVQSILMVMFATTNVIALAPIACSIFIGMCLAWIYAVKALSKRVDKDK